MEYLLFQNVDKSIRIASIYENETLELYIINDNESFYCKITPNDVKNFASSFEMEIDKYMESLVTFMRNRNIDITVEVVGDDFFIYKNKKIKYFFSKIQKTDYSSTIGKVLDSISSNIAVYKELASDLSKTNEFLQNENTILKDKLENYVVDNDAREKKLYSCFVQVLNEKKKRIRFLNDLLDSQEFKRIKPELLMEDVPGCSSKAPEMLSDSDEYNTDDEISNLNDDKMGENVPLIPRREKKGKKGGAELRIYKSDMTSTTTEIIHDNSTKAASLSPISFNTQDIIDRL